MIKGILANLELNGHLDYSTYREFEDSQRRYCDLMSSDWVWRQSVHRLACGHIVEQRNIFYILQQVLYSLP